MVNGHLMLGLVLVAILMPELVTMSLTLSAGKGKLSVNRVCLLSFLTLVVNLSLFLFAQYPGTKSLDIASMVKAILALDFTYQSARSFVYIIGICLIFSLILGLWIESALLDGTPGIKLPQGGVLLALLVIWAVLFFASDRLGAYSYERLNIVSSKHNVRNIVNDVPVIEEQVEIANTGAMPCVLDGLYLTDTMDNKTKMPLSGMSISPGERLSVWTEDFFAAGEGKTLYMYDDEGTMVSEFDPKGPGAPDEPVFSAASGYYGSSFELTLAAANGVKIYYSLDGGDPAIHGVLYTDPIMVYDRSAEETVFRSYPRTHYDWQYEVEQDTSPVDRCFTVRAVAIDDHGRMSETVTGTYFIDKDQYDGIVISLTADPEDLFGEYGICVTGKDYDEWALSGGISNAPKPNFEKTGREWEIPGEFDFFEGGEYIGCDAVGLRVQGGSSRTYDIKRFSVYAREEYGGSDYFSLDLYDDDSDVHSVVMRPSVVNAAFPLLVEDRDVIGIRSVPVTVFLNGEYWYDTYMGEKYSPEFFHNRYGISEGNLLMIKGREVDEGDAKDMSMYTELFDYVATHDLSNEEEYEGFGDLMDIQSYIDYSVINLYAVNLDADEMTNVILWRTKNPEAGAEYADCRWRWGLYDMDALDWVSGESYGVDSRAAINTFVVQPPHEEILPFNQQTIYAALKKNPDFCRRFVLSFMDIINTNFSVENVSRVLEELGRDMSWKESFFEERPGYMIEYLGEEFELEGPAEELTVMTDIPEGGTIKINTCEPDMSTGEWVGRYYTDYPVTVSVETNSGWRFVGWTGSIESEKPSIEVEMKPGGIALEAHFEKDQ